MRNPFRRKANEHATGAATPAPGDAAPGDESPVPGGTAPGAAVTGEVVPGDAVPADAAPGDAAASADDAAGVPADAAEDQPAEPVRKPRARTRSRSRLGVLGVVVTAMVVIVALNVERLPLLTQVTTYSAYFGDAGGLSTGDKVMVAGVHVGNVERIRLARSGKTPAALVTFRLNETVILGDRTRAAVGTETVLGRRFLNVEPMGGGRIMPGDSIPLESTASPYSMSDVLEDSTRLGHDTDTDQLNDSLRVLTEAFEDTPAEVRGAVDGVARLSKAIADRDDALDELLGRAGSVLKLVGARNQQVNQLMVDANLLLGELEVRRQALRELIIGTNAVAQQLSGFVDDNMEQLGPVLAEVNSALAIFNDNDQNLTEALQEMGPYANTLGEAVSSGPYFSSLVGLPTFGDYTGTFLRILQGKYPEAFEYFYTYGGFPFFPSSWSLAPGRSEPDATRPTPSPDYPQPPGAGTPRQGGGR